jgi:DNA transformation protein
MAFREFLEELYAPMGDVRVRPMFGGLGIFKDDLMFALAFDDVLYLRADEATAARFAAENSSPFIYKGMKGREIETSYFRLPDRLYDEPDELIAWSETALGVAQRAAAEKAGPRKVSAPRKAARERPTKKPAKRPVGKRR